MISTLFCTASVLFKLWEMHFRSPIIVGMMLSSMLVAGVLPTLYMMKLKAVVLVAGVLLALEQMGRGNANITDIVGSAFQDFVRASWEG
jgi:hypothetical protein